MGLAILISSAHTAHFNSEGQELSNSDQDNDSKNKMDTRVMQKKRLNIILSPMWFKILDSGSKESNIPLVDNEFESVKILGVLVFT